MTPTGEAASGARTAYRPHARFFGPVPDSYRALNRRLLESSGEALSVPTPTDGSSLRRATALADLDTGVKVVALPVALAPDLSTAAIRGMERLRELGKLTALRGERATDLPRPEGGRIAALVRSEAQALVLLVESIERVLADCPLFVRAIKMDRARASSTATSRDRAASNLHFDAEKSSLAEYADPVFQFYLNAGALERQFQILPVAREEVLESVAERERTAQPLGQILARYLEGATPPLEIIPVPSGSLAIFDGRRFAHDAGKCDVAALLDGRFEPSSEPDLVLALDTTETGYHEGLYRPDLPFFEDAGL